MQNNTLYTVIGKYNVCMGHFDKKVERLMRKMIVDDVVVGVAHIAMSWYWGAWQLWYMMRLMCDQQPSWYHRWSTNHWHTCLWSSLSAVPHDQLVFSIFRLASICESFICSCFFLNSAFLSLYKQVMQRSETKSGFVMSVIFSILYISVEARIIWAWQAKHGEHFVIVFVCCIWYFVNTSERSAMRGELWARLAVWSVACESPAGSSSLRPNPPLMQPVHWETLIFCI